MYGTTMRLSELLAVVRRHFLKILLTAIVLGMATFLVNRFGITPQYTARASVYVYVPAGSDADGIAASSALSAAQKLVGTYMVILESDSVLDKVAQQLSLDDTAQELREMLTAAALQETGVLTISVTNPNPQTATDIANTILEVAPGEIERVAHAGSVKIIDRAKLPETPSSPALWRNTALGAFTGFTFSLLFYTLAAFSEKVRRPRTHSSIKI